ncbi:MAG: hypothetical protein WA775_11465 [Psychroserpens sp.]|uniref:hypothetical protein n=1 Tax=Psychroserpens sp. TaxID=2020870 RepID=UPI003C78B2E4
MGIIKYYSLEEAELFIFDEFIINQIREGVLVETNHKQILDQIIQRHFTGKKMVYISNRAKSYAVNPLIYPEAEKIPKMIAIAMIPHTETMRKNAEYERKFYDKPYEIFKNLPDAINWAHNIMAAENKSVIK